MLVLIAIFAYTFTIAQMKTRFEISNGNETPTYFEAIDWWKKLDAKSEKVFMNAMGSSDAGEPLHLILVSNRGVKSPGQINHNAERVIFINNGIHPGEPDGIDATMLLVRDIVDKKVKLPDGLVLGIIPVYNIGGCLNRSKNYRVDQNGPEAFGFRGNSQNLDLNRDFIKCDSKEAKSFAEIFHLLSPDVFLDNHVSNGADYQHVMTLLTSQHRKYDNVAGDYLRDVFEPALYQSMSSKGFPMVPYVNVWGSTPDKGWTAFWDSPRYGSGYAALFNCFSFVAESHMLKPYDQRVKATYALMQSFIDFVSSNSAAIKKIRDEADNATRKATVFPIEWTLDRNKFSKYIFKGYASEQVISGVSGLPVLHYDRNKPYQTEIPHYDNYLVSETVVKPQAYIIPKGWWSVIELLKLNKVNMRPLTKDSIVKVESYKIKNYKSSPVQYEKHHLNTNIVLETIVAEVKFTKGDWYIPMNQNANRFISDVLEPKAKDSYFAWNFFDAILGQKEGYSGYAFEPIAADYLKQNPALQKALEEKRKADSSFAKNAGAQLEFVYNNSPWLEPAFMQYPVYRLMK